ncbi:transcription termination factor NusA [Candidatus Gracilibacteria bacterium]|nr:transcription termination factor NusA [Candidatus Gracilibacteria bacterium]MBS9784170.1 transcription termination factor NusA [Candidatus Gracilibacteria bacterium]
MFDLQKIDAAVTAIAVEKKIDKERLVSIIEDAIKTAYKKDFACKEAEVNVHLDMKTGAMEISILKTIVATEDDVEDEDLQISYEEIGGEESGYEIGDVVELDVSDDIEDTESFGRIASQAAKQVIVQKIGETEKEKLYHLFKDKEDTIVNMRIELVEKNRVVFDYNGHQVVLPKSEQNGKDRYTPGQRMNLYVRKVEIDEVHGPRVILSRKDKELVVKLFEANTPELDEGLVDIVSIARIPGAKTKIIVASDDSDIDPAGCLIGPKGTRVRTIVDELFGEKIDILNYTTNQEEMVRRALVPGMVESIEIDDENTTIIATVTEEEKGKVLGRNGTNINIAGELLGYRINLQTLKSETDESEEETIEE